MCLIAQLALISLGQQTLRLEGTQMSSPDGSLPSFVRVVPDGARSGDSFAREYTCPGLGFGFSTLFTLSPTYYQYSLCTW